MGRATKTEAAYRFLSAPLFVESEATAQTLLQQPTIADAITAARRLDVLLCAIDVIDSRHSELFRTGHFNGNQIDAYRAKGVVGELLGQLIDARGQPADGEANRCLITEPLDAVQAIPCAVGIAGEAIKAPAILAAQRGGYLNVLVNDAGAALAVLDLHAQI